MNEERDERCSAVKATALGNSQSLLVMILHLAEEYARFSGRDISGISKEDWVQEELTKLLTEQIVENRAVLNEPQPALVPDLDTAWQWDGKELLHDTPDWVAENTEPTWSSLDLAGFTGGITAFTSFGKACLKKGDWLVRHEGEIHAVKDAVYSALTRPK